MKKLNSNYQRLNYSTSKLSLNPIPMKKTFIITALLLLGTLPVQAQFPTTDEVLKGEKTETVEQPKKQIPNSRGVFPNAAPDLKNDVSSLDNIVHAIYDVISGPKDAQINMERWNNLFVEGAILAPTGKNQSGAYQIRVVNPQEFMDMFWNKGMRPWDFYEIETDRSTDSFGSVTQIFSTYESRRDPAEAEPFQRGINSMQFYNDGNRWWVVSIFWDSERADQKIPQRYDG